MTWAGIERALAIVGACSLVTSVAVLVVAWLLTRNADGLNRNSS